MTTDLLRDAAPARLDIPVVRQNPAKVEARQDEDGPPTMVGHFSVFDSWYEVNSIFEGHFLERVAPGAFKKTFAERGTDGIKVTFNHGYDFTMGDQVLGVASELREDDTGAYYEVPLLRGVPDLIVSGLEAGAYGSSFRFRVIKDEWNDAPEPSEHNPRGIPERTIKETDTREFGPVTYPASPEATAGIRSGTDEFYEQLRQRSPAEYERMVERAIELRTPAADGTGAASQETGEPPHGTRRTPKHAAQLVRRIDTLRSAA